MEEARSHAAPTLVKAKSKPEDLAPKREDKFDKEKQLLMIMDEMTEQIGNFSTEDKEADFVKISETLQHYGLSPRFCMRFWDGMRKKLRE